MNRTARLTAVAALAVALPLSLASGCSGKATGGSGGTGADGVKTGPGVTDDTIRVGAATDLTGVYAPLGKSLTQAQQMYFEQVNAQGGICGRKIELVVRDHGYDVQKAVAGYSEMQSSVIGLAQFVGSPMVTALKQRITSDKMFVIPNAWATTLLGNKYIQVTGTTYDVDMINALDFLTKEKGIKKGDKIGHVYFEGDYGESALAGSKYAAGELGLTIVEQKIKATDNDMTAQVSALKEAGVAAILMSAGPKQSASLAGVARAKGIMAPIVASNSGFSPQLLQTPAAPALLKGFYMASAGAPISSDLPAIKKLADDYGKKYPGQPRDSAVVNGYTGAVIFADALKKACQAKDLTRDGLIAAHRSTTAHDGGYGTPMDFSKVDEPGTRKTYILRTDAKALGGMVVERDAAESEAAETYKVPAGA
ncbi:ABC-type branched-chain amino acid transport system, substrate-binding protein [Actinomadura meyerae]|uniref:ABC-type branched-chain amino acid transport system, substrate-binding protein n=1 Tax=Actinomadura meyerae TaxID=240840 RepID=A0A239C393_9ACTN|nr:ABC transporter substrate-binding protein [Actinomadura meyerae]SNS14128.1 ABC-type branched-chain amino acid transport system, substrate-binding protein [Actinomadura meyerae]